MLLTQFLDDYYVPLRLRGRSRESVRLLHHAIRAYSRHLGRPATLDDLEDLAVSRFLMARSAAGLSPHSVARERSGLLALWNLARARGLVALAPCVQPEVLPEKTPRAFTTDELGRLYAAAGAARGYVGAIPAGVWFRALMLVAFETSERIGALLKAPVTGWHRPTLIVPPHVRKGGRAGRAYDVSPACADLLDATSRNDAGLVLHWPYSTTALYKRWHTITRAAGLGDGRDVQFHALRRSTASHLTASGGSAQNQLGHSSDRVTRKYLDPRIVNAARPKVWQLLPRIAPSQN